MDCSCSRSRSFHGISLALHGDLAGLDSTCGGLGTEGAVLVVGLMLVHAILFSATEIVTATAGFGYRCLPGLAIVVVGWPASAVVTYLLARTIGGPPMGACWVRAAPRPERDVATAAWVCSSSLARLRWFRSA